MAIININWRNLISGESSTDFTPDRGFSPKSFGLNLTKERGVLHFAENPTAIGTLTDNVVATEIDPKLLGNDLYLVDESAHFYYLDGTTLTDANTGVYTYQRGTTDMKFFENNWYFTSRTTIGTFNANMATVTEDWWSRLDNNARHPIEVIESEMFVADNNLIYYFDGSASGTAFTLPTTQNVTSLRRHPDGKTLLAFTGDAFNFSHLKSGAGKVYYCDPVIRDWTREVVIESQVEGTRTVGGTIYVTYGNNLGYFDGNGLKFLKELGTSTTYSQSMGAMEDILLVRDGSFVKAFGDLGNGRVWWNMYKRISSVDSVGCVAYLGGDELLACSNTGAWLDRTDYDNIGSAGEFYSNRTYFPEETEIDRIEMIHDTTNGSGTTSWDIASVTVSDASNTIKSVVYTNESTNKTTAGANVKTDVFQLSITPYSDDVGHKNIRIHYDGINK